jgi:hypothetical protein
MRFAIEIRHADDPEANRSEYWTATEVSDHYDLPDSVVRRLVSLVLVDWEQLTSTTITRCTR